MTAENRPRSRIVFEKEPGAEELRNYILDDPSCPGKRVFVVSLVKRIGKPMEVRKTVARTGVGGGRVANLPANGFIQPSSSVAVDVSSNEEKIAVDDFALALLKVGDNSVAVVVEIAALSGPNGANAFESGLTAKALSDPRSMARVRPLEETARVGTLYFTGASSHDEIEVSGSVLMPLTLHAETDNFDGSIKLAANIKALADCAASLWLRLEDLHGSVGSLAPAPMNASHKDSLGVRLFVKEIGAVGNSRAEILNAKCKLDFLV
jgi:hypothetical protein